MFLTSLPLLKTSDEGISYQVFVVIIFLDNKTTGYYQLILLEL